MFKLSLCLFAALCCATAAYAAPTPVVIWHGMGDSCCNPLSMGAIKKLIEQNIPNVYVLSLEIGNNVAEDEANGFLKNVNKQVEMVCEKLANDPNLANGFHGIGFSQGSQFLRAYVQRCNKPAMKNLVSVGGQHQGVYGFPKCPGANSTLCEVTRRLLNIGAYVDWIQATLVQAEYWQDPFNLKEYEEKNIFLADINNQKGTINQTYIDNLNSLNKMVLVKFTEDTMVQPRESEWFGFYAPGQDKQIISMNQTDIYQQNLLPLRTMEQAGKIDFLSVVGDHLRFTDAWFVSTIIPYLAQ
ncbi:palmitoyl protein thioesterase [Capsaspora owczarzaki ATCC 30864]|uniref:Palmitoyl-protein thioesterase 1 n=1 Tax=Capsaspora owczarzaki (strain ATCC 30864) TaxID=595528 RepID=A0A0D2VGA6_CAPO3|nr:palmitoyl protein thioesterase [Capsaspora owczarzaki ATCC 30864]KJE88907.1 palmitoyl protein thioesterase [Capsaspora owczarzaki ATCC 30864]|eukprot:XP_004365354.1 palmitoyl protein thioesterase [Capsaspora owczarzaki ATCC 30864]